MTLFVVVWKRWRWSLPNWRQQAALLKSMSGPSLDFFWLNMSSMATALLGPFLAGAVAGLATAGDFALIQRIFGLLVTLHLALLSPLSPSFTRHASENDWGWITKKFTLCVKRFWPAVFLGGGLVLAVIHPWILQLWTGRWISDYGLVAFLASAAMATGWANTHSVLLNSLGAVRRQALLSLVMLIPVVALPLLLGKFLGVYGIALATTICIMPSAILTTQWVHSALHNKTLAV
jgi:stage V sporulation protein B